MNNESPTNRIRKLSRINLDPRLITVLVIATALVCLWAARLRGVIEWPSWAVLAMTVLGLVLMSMCRAMGMPAVSREVARETFSVVQTQHLRCLSFALPPHWRVEKLDSGSFRLWITECNEWGWINVDVDWLWKTKIDDVKSYRDYAESFVRDELKGHMLRNEITTRWGVPVHEFEYTGKHSTGWKVTIAYHGTEYGIQVATKIAGMYPSAKLIFEQFLALAHLAPPPLSTHTVLGGTLSVGLPPDFRLSNETADMTVWTATHRPGTTISIRRLQDASRGPLTSAPIESLATERPDPSEAFGTGSFSMRELGISGFQTFQATKAGPNGRCWFVAALELVTGGRYLLVFDGREQNAAETFYMGHFRYVQVAMEIIATMSE